VNRSSMPSAPSSAGSPRRGWHRFGANWRLAPADKHSWMSGWARGSASSTRTTAPADQHTGNSPLPLASGRTRVVALEVEVPATVQGFSPSIPPRLKLDECRDPSSRWASNRSSRSVSSSVAAGASRPL